MIESKGVNYYIIDLRQTDFNKISDIFNECAAIESECWKPQESFHDYIKKCDVLSYAVINGQIVGFDVATVFIHEKHGLFSNDETMVLKKFRNCNIARNLVFSTMRWFLKNNSYKEIKHFAFMSISGNPRIVNGYYKHRYIQRFFDCSFNASNALIELMHAYRIKHKISLVHKDYPFVLKNIFPGSNIFNPSEKTFQFTNMVKKHLSKDFDHLKRGDAFAFLVKTSKIFGSVMIFLIMTISFSKKFFSRKGIGFFAPDHF